MEIEFGPFETFSYAIYQEGLAWYCMSIKHVQASQRTQGWSTEEKEKKASKQKACFPSQHFAIWLGKKNISNQFSKVIKHAWILFTFKLSVGSCSSTNVPEKLCSLVLQLPVESFRTKSLPAMHVHHALKEWTCLLGQWVSLVMVCTDNLHSCRAAFLQTPLFPPSATRQIIFRTDQAKAKWKR